MIPYEELVIIGLEVWHVGRFVTLFHPGISLIPTMETQKTEKTIGKRETTTKTVINLKFSIFLGLRYLLFPLSGD